jgi:pyrroloquinoline-quinone synthase
MKREKFRNKIIELIESKSVLKHPFYLKWNEGSLCMDELQEYAKQYHKFVEHFPMFVSSVHSNCSEPEVRKLVMENLADEEGFKTGVPEHPELWINFCRALGVDRDSVLKTDSVQEVKNMIEGFYKFCRDSDYRIGVAALLAYEYQIPEVSRIKIEGLKKYYGINSQDAIEFFTVHQTADIYHRVAELNVLLDKCTTEEDQQKALSVIERATGLYWKMLDGVYVN